MTRQGFESVDNVKGVMKSFEAGVITTFTFAPAFINNLTKVAVLYAAIPAVMPKSIFLPLSIDDIFELFLDVVVSISVINFVI